MLSGWACWPSWPVCCWSWWPDVRTGPMHDSDAEDAVDFEQSPPPIADAGDTIGFDQTLPPVASPNSRRLAGAAGYLGLSQALQYALRLATSLILARLLVP